jgi:C-terminal processing protease CtpA/Prc
MDTGQVIIDQAAHAAVIQNLTEKLKAHYVFPDLAERISERIQQHLEEGAYAQITEGALFAKTLTEHLQEVNQDKHLRVFWFPEPLPEQERPAHQNPEIVEEWRLGASLDNYGLYRVERLAGNVGYLDIRGFFPPEWGGDLAVAAMNFLANASALIVDLRKNGGGSPAMVALITSYLFGNEPVLLNSFYWRTEENPRQSWTLPYVPGKRFGDKPIFVLTSKNTFSGGEEFAYNLKTRQRATLIGEPTGGAAHPGDPHRLHPHFEAFIPGGRPVSPITGTNWEGTGVIPDVPADPEQALPVAYRLALQSVIERIAEPASAPLRRLKDEAQAALQELETR